MRKAAVQLGAYAAMALIAVLGIIALTVSYGRNRTYLDRSRRDVARLQEVPPMRQGASLQTLLPRLDAVRAVVDSANRYQDDVPWAMRLGTVPGKLDRQFRCADAYVRELDGSLLPFVAARFRQRLVQYRRRTGETLRIPESVSDARAAEHVDKKHLQFLADLEWSAANGVSAEQGKSLSRHFQGLLDREGGLRPIALDSAVVAQARTSIRQASIPRIMYAWLKDTYARDDARAVRLDVAAGVGAEQVLRRKSGVSLAEPVPALYGRTVFKELTGRDLPGLVKQFSDERWVWGDSGSEHRRCRQARSRRDRYLRAGLHHRMGRHPERPRAGAVLERSGRRPTALAILSGPTSPLRSLLQTVTDNTSFVEAPESPEHRKPWPVPSQQRARQMADRLGKMFPGQISGGLSATPGARITAHFQPIHRLLAGAPGAAPIDAILDQARTAPGAASSARSRCGWRRSSSRPCRAPLCGIRFVCLQQEAAALPPIIRPLVTQIGAKSEGSLVRGAADDLAARYQAQVLRQCTDFVAGRYPFTPGSPREVPMTDFGRIFGYGGVFDTFFTANLEQLVDRTSTPWTWRPGVDSLPGILEQFEAAQRIREMFFASGSQRPDLRFAVTITDVDGRATRFLLDVEGQRFEYRARRPIRWTGRLARTGARLRSRPLRGPFG